MFSKLLLLIAILPAVAFKRGPKVVVERDRVFLQDYCLLKCGNRTHTMCKMEKELKNIHNVDGCKPKYNVFRSFELNLIRSMKVQKVLVRGHNGLRARIAKRMNVSNMSFMHWDKHLAAHARVWSLQCKPFLYDPCTNWKTKLDLVDSLEIDDRKNAHEFVAQTHYCTNSPVMPQYFIETAMRQWYFEKLKMQPPTLVKHALQITVGTLCVFNNFTIIASPALTRLGCSLTKFDDNYCLVCNYYPFFTNANSCVEYIDGEMGTKCPARLPFPWEGLCASYTDLLMDGSPSKLTISQYLLILEFVVLMSLRYLTKRFI